MKINECISCGSDQNINRSSSEGFNEVIGMRTFTQDAYSILECSNCGLYYKDHVIDESVLNEYYNSFDFKAWQPVANYPTEDIVEAFLFSKEGLKVLDYGCSEGRLISKFVNKHTCYGYDIDNRALAIAKAKGIEVVYDISQTENTPKFDVIILSDVFEHSLAPTKLIGELLAMLNKSGTLIISTGNADSKACQFDMAHFWYFQTIQHVCMLGSKYIKFLESEFKLTVLKERFCSHYKASIKQKLFYKIRFNLFRFIHKNRKGMIVGLISNIPFARKITKWKVQPYYPFSKDHVVLFLQQ
ncbi:hypothetical protein BH11BAC4_BH11BAC4_01220 [soil metagenome]